MTADQHSAFRDSCSFTSRLPERGSALAPVPADVGRCEAKDVPELVLSPNEDKSLAFKTGRGALASSFIQILMSQRLIRLLFISPL